MLLKFVHPLNSIREAVSTDEISDFVVITGPNGSGKSNLLQAIAEGAIEIDGVPRTAPSGHSNVQLFRLSELVTQAESPQSPAAYRERWVQLGTMYKALVAQYSGGGYSGWERSQVELQFRQSWLAQQQISEQALDVFLSAAGKDILSLDMLDFKRHAPLLIGVRDPFQLSITEVFLSYHQRRNANDRDLWLTATQGRADLDPLDQDDFVQTYGVPPWDALNQVLRIVGMPYRFIGPVGTDDDLPYEPLLTFIPEETQIRVDQLSTGERTLLAIALSMYTGNAMTTMTRLPKILLLDEIDASLHPSMVESVLRVISEIFVKQHRVKVILTSHSPTTVALAPEDAVYQMRRSGSPRLQKASWDDAIASLSVGLPTLSVRLENRRQVFVESEYDQRWYQAMFDSRRPSLDSPFSLTFLPAAKGKGGNSAAVVSLVTQLHQGGNETVWGVVDRDSRRGAPARVLFNSSRYAIENLILDPLLLGAYLMRNHLISPQDVGIDSSLRHFELTAHHGQPLADYLAFKIARPGDDPKVVDVDYVGGFTVAIPSWWLNIQGHELEERVKDAFPELNRDRGNLLANIVRHVFKDLPSYIPREVDQLFKNLLR